MSSNLRVKPSSAVTGLSVVLSASLSLAGVLFYKFTDILSTASIAILLIVNVGILHGLFSLHHLQDKKPKKIYRSDIYRVATKLFALAIIYLTILAVYFLFEGFSRDFVLPLREVITRMLIPFIIVSIIYVVITDYSMENPNDDLYLFGQSLLVRKLLNKQKLNQLILGWVIKAFFIPILFVALLNNLTFIKNIGFNHDNISRSIFDFAFNMFFLFDVLYATAGYFCTLKLFNAEIKSVDRTFRGWVVCIICYSPFWAVISQNFLRYQTEFDWNFWLSDSQMIWHVWAIAILICMFVYTWSTVSFGNRFSNLTNRGIITHGPYCWMRHPAYVSKNISWWLISVPFIANVSPIEAVKNCILLLLVNYIYYLRAKTEEIHLSHDRTYREYSLWIKNNGILSKLIKLRRGFSNQLRKLANSSN